MRWSRGRTTIFLILWGMAIVRTPSAAGDDWTPVRLLKAIQTLEQVGIHREHHAEFSAILDERMLVLSRLAIEAFEKETGIPVVDKPRNPGWSAQEMNRWILALRERRPEERCNLVRLAYAVSISRLSLLKASVSEPPSFPVTAEELASPEFSQDVDRALWELRYFWPLPADAPWAPRNCMDMTFPKFSIVREARARIEFLERGATVKTGPFRRWPLGRAAKMCGRPFHTHYADHLALRSDSREQDTGPIRMQAITEASEFRIELQELERRALGSQP